MSPVIQDASIAAWQDEAHVRENRRLYRAKFDALVPLLAPVLDAPRPEAGFYLWARVPPAWKQDDEAFARDLVAQANVTVLPGRYLAREAHGTNPGAGRVRIALVATMEECLEAARRIIACCEATLHIQGAMSQHPLEAVIDAAFDRRSEITPKSVDPATASAIEQVIADLDQGRLRVAEKIDGEWITHQWVKKAVLLYFRTHDNQIIHGGEARYFDKVPTKFATYSDADFRAGGMRVVPPAVARRGAFIAPNAILMPSYVNIGAYVDEGTMVDTWATVGSCAQIGKNVHLSGGVGIGGVLEPLQANPTIIEDNCFIGARSEIVEGVVVEAHSVISMGVFIGQSTRIYDRASGKVIYGRVPSGSVVVPGALPAPDGTHTLACAVIVKRVDAQTRAKTSLNDLLRD